MICTDGRTDGWTDGRTKQQVVWNGAELLRIVAGLGLAGTCITYLRVIPQHTTTYVPQLENTVRFWEKFF